MKLIGMLDSPFVRRVAISLQVLKLPFQHESVSVFRGFSEFQRINPVVKAPTLICADGTVLMDSTLILQWAQSLAQSLALGSAQPRSLLPGDLPSLQRELRLIGLALAACEKTAQIVYERGLRPAEKQHEPWVQRVSGQLLAAFRELEQELACAPLDVSPSGIGQAGISVAVAWYFTQQLLPQVVPAADFARLVALSEAAETLPEFARAPYGEGVYRSGDAG